jgi:PHD/YefM family antitoxin component YafN of YafNO toxin-antitoxin module
MASWQFGEAQLRLNEVIDAAKTSGPQLITLPDNDQAMLLSLAEYSAPYG